MNNKKADRIINQILMFLDASNVEVIEAMAIVSTLVSEVLSEIIADEEMSAEDAEKTIAETCKAIRDTTLELAENIRKENNAKVINMNGYGKEHKRMDC